MMHLSTSCHDLTRIYALVADEGASCELVDASVRLVEPGSSPVGRVCVRLAQCLIAHRCKHFASMVRARERGHEMSH